MAQVQKPTAQVANYGTDQVQKPTAQVANYGTAKDNQAIEMSQPSSSTIIVKSSKGESACYQCGTLKDCYGTCLCGSIGALIGGFFGLGCGLPTGWTIGSSAAGCCLGGILGYYNIDGNSKQ